MIEVVVMVLLIVIGLVVALKYNYTLAEKIAFEKEQEIITGQNKLKIAEKKYMQGKIKSEVFEQLKDDLNYKMILTQLDIFRIKKMHALEIEEKAEKLFEKLIHPTKHRKAKLRHLLMESEVLRKEIKFIEKKLLKNEITENVFKRLISQKEDEMIEKENEIIIFVKSSNI